MFEFKAYAVAFSALIGIVWVAVLPFAILSFVKARSRKDAARKFVTRLRASMVLFVIASSLFFAQSVILVNSYFASFVDWRVARASIHLGHLVQLFKTLSGAAVMEMLVALSPDLRYAMAGAGTKPGKMLRVAAMGLAFVVAVLALAAYGLGVDYEENYSAIWNAASLSSAVNRARVTNQVLAATDIMLWIAALFISGLSIFTIVHGRDSPLVTACFLYILASLLNLTGATWNFAYAVGWKLTPRRSMNPGEPQYLMILYILLSWWTRGILLIMTYFIATRDELRGGVWSSSSKRDQGNWTVVQVQVLIRAGRLANELVNHFVCDAPSRRGTGVNVTDIALPHHASEFPNISDPHLVSTTYDLAWSRGGNISTGLAGFDTPFCVKSVHPAVMTKLSSDGGILGASRCQGPRTAWNEIPECNTTFGYAAGVHSSQARIQFLLGTFDGNQVLPMNSTSEVNAPLSSGDGIVEYNSGIINGSEVAEAYFNATMALRVFVFNSWIEITNGKMARPNVLCMRVDTTPIETSAAPSFTPLGMVSALEAYNTTKQAYDIIDAADRSEEATRFWTELKNYDGIVAIDDAFAEQLNLPPSVPHPDNPSTKIYQVNVFHSLHCLYRIRNRLISKVPLDKWPRDDIHTMHCLDHIRNDLMCNVDLSLSGSSEYISFNHGHRGKKCRDLGAVQEWSRRNAWTGYREYLKDVIGFDLMEAERANLAAAGGGHWDQANSTFDKETGKITFWFEEE
ncbi:Phenylalanine aminomutase [Colletotrichum spinosum]|uniref:Phenylalanine aminomutase n=1 Tax=Colletotrichum spinosum TaxID=1347390 RepID=A0A4R8Q1Z8_9PEZI|nr:Phenylalanine aminomutase [Colletotrichum spinosum]